MSALSPAILGGNEQEITALLEVLLKTGQQLEEITSGQVDTAADSEGRVLLLRGTHEQLKNHDVSRQAAILNALPANIALLDSEGIILSVNEGWRLFAGLNSPGGGPDQEPGVSYLAVCDSATGAGQSDAHYAAEGVRSVLNGSEKSFSFDYQCNESGEECWFQLNVTPLSTDRPMGAVVMHRNVSSSKHDQANLLSLASRLSLAAGVGNVGVWEWDIASNALTWDATMFAIYGFPRTGAMSYERWAGAVHPQDLREVEATLQRTLTRGSEEAMEFRIIAGDGTVRYVSAVEKAVVDQSGHVCRVVGVNVDVTHRRKAEEELRSNQLAMTHLAEHDPLTDLPNQRVLRDRMNQAIKMAARNKAQAAILFLDLDGFKHINDSLGHQVGDELLQSVAARLQNCVRGSDTVSRFGGDEFCVLLPDVHHPEGTVKTAATILASLGARHSVSQHELQVTASIGISVYPDDGLDGETLIKNADSAMYQAKDNGGSSYQFFHRDMNIVATERQFIEQNLRRALERKELVVHYQPKLDMKTRAFTGVEALLRWNHPSRGPIPPDEFIPVAEDCGLILPIGIWVLEEACRQTREWLDAGLPAITVAVNVSGRQIQSEHFQEAVMGVLQRTRLNPRCLELEVTESLLMKSPARAAFRLKTLRRLGISVALDDFGTGYSSLSHLQQLPIDSLKIDQTFVRKMDTPTGVSMVSAIINLARGLGMNIVAEGVETQQEATILESMGCEMAQGYYFSRPLPPAGLSALLEQHL